MLKTPPQAMDFSDFVAQQYKQLKSQVVNIEHVNLNLFARILNPHYVTLPVLFVRMALIVSLITLLVGIDVVCDANILYDASLVACIVAANTVAFLVIYGLNKLNANVGKRHPLGEFLLPMVHWFSPLVFLDLIYHTVSIDNKLDSKSIYNEKVDEIHIRNNNDSNNSGNQVEGYFIDFVADTGDGFNPTYAVASAMSSSEIRVRQCDGANIKLPAARTIIHGGDLCYPTPRYADILKRFFLPYQLAFHSSAIEREMFIIPGNHEYMDDCNNFRHMILNNTNIGEIKLPQNSRYCTLKLPNNWWFFLTDQGADNDMDEIQIEYFQQIVKTQFSLNEQLDKVVLVYHAPPFVKNHPSMGFDLYKRQQHFQASLGNRLRLVLSGDLHYYKRFQELRPDEESFDHHHLAAGETEFGKCYVTSRKQIIVAGHGGAFGHPTSVPNCDECELGHPHLPPNQRVRFAAQVEYPTKRECDSYYRTNCFKSFLPSTNGSYGHILAMLYHFTFMSVNPLLFVDSQFSVSTAHTWQGTAISTFALTHPSFYLTLVWLSAQHFIMASENYSMKNRSFLATAAMLGAVHTAMHLACLLALRLCVDRLLVAALFESAQPGASSSELVVFTYCTLSHLLMFTAAYFVAPVVTLLYFSTSFLLVRWHYNEAYCAPEDQQHKGFLRLCIKPSGELEVYSLVLEETPSDWRYDPAAMPRLQPSYGALRLRLLEKITLVD